MKDLPIGIFDSGMGGISLLREMKNLMPYEDYIYYGDSKHIPYGKKTKEELIRLCTDIGDYFIKREVKAIVIACNTATSAAVDVFRNKYEIPIVGIEPALKPAVEMYKTGKIVVLATQVTLKEEKFNKLMKQYEKQAHIIKIPAPNLVTLVESGKLSGEEVELAIKNLFNGIELKDVSSVVLGCTHYPFLKETLKKVLGPIPIIDGGHGTALHLYDILKENGCLKKEDRIGTIEILNSSKDQKQIDLSYELLNL